MNRLNRKYPAVAVDEIVALLLSGAEVVSVGDLDVSLCADPSDDKFMACALESGALAVVSGDGHLLAVDGFRGVRVFTPADLVRDFLK